MEVNEARVLEELIEGAVALIERETDVKALAKMTDRELVEHEGVRFVAATRVRIQLALALIEHIKLFTGKPGPAHVATVRPGDLVVFAIDRTLSQEQMKQLREQWSDSTGTRGVFLPMDARHVLTVKGAAGLAKHAADCPFRTGDGWCICAAGTPEEQGPRPG